MNCPYCNRKIEGVTGLQELSKFQKHLSRCTKHPDRKVYADHNGKLRVYQPAPNITQALEIRAKSGQ